MFYNTFERSDYGTCSYLLGNSGAHSYNGNVKKSGTCIYLFIMNHTCKLCNLTVRLYTAIIWEREGLSIHYIFHLFSLLCKYHSSMDQTFDNIFICRMLNTRERYQFCLICKMPLREKQ